MAIVSETFARVYSGGHSVLGARIGVSRPEFTIVGIARDAKYAHVREPVAPVWYVPYEQQPNVKYLNLLVRTTGDPDSLTAAVRAAIAAVDPQVALFEVRSIETQVDDLLAGERMLAVLATAFGSIAAALAALGVYGVLAFIVTTRRREIGIRMALGARPAAILRETIAAAWSPLAAGLLIGTAAAAILTRYAATLLYGLTPLDPVSFAAGIIGICVVVTAAASSRRAAPRASTRRSRCGRGERSRVPRQGRREKGKPPVATVSRARPPPTHIRPNNRLRTMARSRTGPSSPACRDRCD